MVGNLSELSGLFIRVNNKSNFVQKLQEGSILSTSVAFILDTNEIWAQGKYFPCPYSKEEIDQMFQIVNQNITTLDGLYQQLSSDLQRYQDNTNQLILDKEASASQALLAEINRATQQEIALAQSIAQVSNNLSQESQRAVAAENDLRNTSKLLVEEVSQGEYYKQYILKQGEIEIGTIDIPKDQSITEGTIRTVTEVDSPYLGAAIGDKYFDFVSPNSPTGHIYVEANDLVDTYTQGNGIQVENKVISVKIDSNSEGFLTLGTSGVKLSGVQEAINSGLATKVDKVTGKSLVSDAQITKLEGLSDQATTVATIEDAKKAGTDAQASITQHTSDTSNPHGVTKAQVGLGNVDNTSDVNKPISTATQNALDSKVDKVSGKGLSTNDYTTDEKTKLAGIESGANKTIIDSALSSTSTNPVQNKIVKSNIDDINTKISWKTIE